MKYFHLRAAIVLTTIMLSLLSMTCTLLAAPQNLVDASKLLKAPVSKENQQQVLDYFKKRYQKEKDLSQGLHKTLIDKTDDGGGYAGWFLKAAPGDEVIVFAEKGRQWPMIELGDSGYFAWVEKFPNFSSAHYHFSVNGKRLQTGRYNRFGFESYEWAPESLKQAGVPQGKLIQMPAFKSTKQYPGTVRDWWVYVPAQYSKTGPPAKLIVFTDGSNYCHGDGNATIVLDNLIHAKKIPVSIAVFINPGVIPASGKGKSESRNRSNEYDTCTAQYATFLDQEMLPIVRQQYRISEKPEDHLICGASSGGSCAFTAAWHRTDLFQKVISFVGSFCDFRGINDYPSRKKNTIPLDQFGPWKTAHDYPGLIRKEYPPKPLKVFLQDGDNDLDNKLGNWFLNNERMAAALAYSGYDHWFVTGHGIHSSRHGKAVLPEALVWIWNSDQK
ncbi:alpha/beta hydrolase [Gimesia algae]|uniref:Enterobactin/ferric enterobactin esterase n=1 Tax=Gimesia algae TaxID=2527971 RepID=A0A517VDG0_9PLAN|nr:alpha/beta hydrolase-fold protein [Gimesia algae]QDT91045.1 enterobactin/ferric enterobactin esterase [Gimesia algae]